jgi:hypothetical protein
MSESATGEHNVGEVSEKTRVTEAEDAQSKHRADRPATEEEAELADAQTLDDGVAEHYRAMTDKGVNEVGEGRIT